MSYKFTGSIACMSLQHDLDEDGLYYVLQRKSRGAGMWPCSICGQSYSNQYNLKRHMNAHVGKYPYMCEICGKGSTNPAHIKEHMTTHTGVNNFKCDQCGETFQFKKAMLRHQTKCNPIPAAVEENDNKD